MKLLTKNAPFTAAEVVDKANIIELVQFERFCRDNSLFDEMNKTYTDDAKIEISWFQGSAKDFVSESAKMAGNTRTSHQIYNTQVWMDGDRAVAIMQASIKGQQELEGTKLNLSSDSKIVYELQRVDGEWLIHYMTCIYEADTLVPLTPVDNVKVDQVELASYRPSYACLAYTLHSHGYDIDQDLPGIDRPEQVNALYQTMNDWLEAK